MQLSAEHTRELPPLNFKGFPDGIDLRSNPEDIPITALAGCLNKEFDPLNGVLRDVHGLTVVHDAGKPVASGFTFNGVKIFSSNGSLYWVDLVSHVETLIGALTGTSHPVFCLWDNDLAIASGGKLQQLTPAFALSTLANSPNCDNVWIDGARVCVTCRGDDFIYQSAVGDITAWNTTSTPKKDWTGAVASDGKYVEIGYKDGMDIVGVVKLSKDLIVFKAGPDQRKAYRLIGQYPNWEVVDAAPDADCIHCLAALDFALFVGWTGFKALETVTEYGDVKSSEIGDKINTQLVKNIDSSARLWHLPNRKQIWIKGQADKTVWVFHYNIHNPETGSVGAFTRRSFSYQINDVIVDEIDTYVCYGNKIAKIDASVATDDDQPIQGVFITKRFVSENDFLIMQSILDTSNIVSGTGLLQIGDKMIPLNFPASGDIAGDDTDVAADDIDPAYGVPYRRHKKKFTKRVNAFDVRFYTYSGNAGFRHLTIKLAEV